MGASESQLRSQTEVSNKDFFGIQHRRRLQEIAKSVDEDPYDPRKPEYILPTTAQEYQEWATQMRHQQADCLEAAVVARERDAVPSEAGVLDHYLAVAAELREEIPPVPAAPSDESIRKKCPKQCPVCLEVSTAARSPNFVLVVLACGHPLCGHCAAKCAASGLSHCPVCRFPHLLDPQCLASRKEQWRQHYGQWRSGCAQGAAGETSTIHEPVKYSTAERESLKALPEAIQAFPLHELLGWKRQDKVEAMLARIAAHPVVTSNGAGDLMLRSNEARLVHRTKEPQPVLKLAEPCIHIRQGDWRSTGLVGCLIGVFRLLQMQTV